MDLFVLAPHEYLLVAVAFFIAIWNTSVGPSGAVTFATMAALLPPPIVVPIHAVCETGANIARTAVLWPYVDWSFVLPFMIGGLIGFGIGIPILDQDFLSEDALRIVLGSFILIATWVPLARLGPEKGYFSGAGGAITSFMTLFVGATTPLVAAVIGQRHEDHRQVLGTSAACMLYQHAAKILVFGILGFSFITYWKLLLFLVIGTVGGTFLGRGILLKVPQTIIKPIFKALITLLGARLLYLGVAGLAAA